MSHEQEITAFIKAADAMVAAAEHFEGITGGTQGIVDGLVDNISYAKSDMLDNMVIDSPLHNARELLDDLYAEIEKSVRSPRNRIKEALS